MTSCNYIPQVQENKMVWDKKVSLKNWLSLESLLSLRFVITWLEQLIILNGNYGPTQTEGIVR
jgi:hypothetical protein